MFGHKPSLVSIGRYLFDPELARLTTASGEEVHLEPKHRQTLTLLVEQRGHTVSWSQFKERLWTELTIETEELPKRVSTRIHYLREKLGRDGHLIVSHPGRGYELVAERQPVAGATGFPALGLEVENAVCLSTITSRTMFHLNAALAAGGGRYRGWSHHFYERNITAIGSAYGLRIARLASLGQPASAVQYSKVVEGLLARRRRGLWIGAAGQGPVEATAWVLRGLSGWVRLDDIAESVQAFERAVDDDEMLAVRVNSLSLAVAVLAMVSPHSKVLERLTARLQNCCETPDALQYWPQEIGSERAAKGSAVHTAHAALALLEAHAATGGRVGCDRAGLQGVREWLLRQSWDNGSEIISRGKRPRPLTVNHYTSPWVIKALLRLGEVPTNNLVRTTVRQIVADQSDGLWPWGSGIQKPLWATHDALTALVEWLRSAAIGEFVMPEAALTDA